MPVEEEDVHDSSLEEEEPIAARTRSHDSAPIATRTRSQEGLTDIAGFADIKLGSNLNEWLNEIAFVTSEMSDPSKPKTFQQAWWHSVTEFRQPLQVQSHLEMPGILVQLGHIQRT